MTSVYLGAHVSGEDSFVGDFSQEIHSILDRGAVWHPIHSFRRCGSGLIDSGLPADVVDIILML